MIELETLVAMFDGIAAGPKWDMSKPMLWGYFFTGGSTHKLEAAATALRESGYRVVDLREAEAEEGEEPYFLLHVERTEVHGPQSLHERNAELYAFAERHELRSYDGMDVGPLPVTPP